MAETATLVESIAKLSVLEVSEFVKALEEKFGVKQPPRWHLLLRQAVQLRSRVPRRKKNRIFCRCS